MPELDYALLADAARDDGGLVSILAAGIDTFLAPQEPANATMAIVLRVGFTRNECGRPHRVEMLLQGEDGETVARVNGTTTPEWPAHHPVNWKTYSSLVINLAVSLPLGQYQVIVMIDDTEAKSLPFRVRELG